MNLDYLLNRHWYAGQMLSFSGLDGLTACDTGLVAITAFDTPGLEIKLPIACSLRFALQHIDSAFGSDFFVIHGTDSLGQPCTIRGVFADAHHILIQGPVQFFQADNACSGMNVITCNGNDKTLIGVESYLQPQWLDADFDEIYEARSRWLRNTPVPDFGNELRSRTLARALCVMKSQVMQPEGNITHRWTTPDRWPHRWMWLWDSAFHAIGWRHLDPQLAQEMLQAVLGQQNAEGFIPHMTTPTMQSSITQPPVLAFAASLLREFGATDQWYSQIYPALAGYVRWDLAHRDTDGDGLVEWFIENDPDCRSGESGMDNSTRFDKACKLGAVDFNSFLALECQLLGEMADGLGKNQEAMAWQGESQRLASLIRQRLYDPDTGFFYDSDTTAGKLSPVMASSGFLPLICGAANADQALSLVSHLQNFDTFGTPFPIASIANDLEERSTDMWRGPAWICINWLVAYGLQRYGYHNQASTLRHKTIEEIERWFDQYGVFFEYYDEQGKHSPTRLMRKGKVVAENDPNPHPYQAIRDYGWTATLYVDLVLSEAKELCPNVSKTGMQSIQEVNSVV